MKKTFFILLLLQLFFILSCKDSVIKIKENSNKYNHPNYPNGYIYFHQSEYGHDCGDSEYWSEEVHSKEFNVNDSLFLSIVEKIVLEEVPNLTLAEIATLESSNGDVEKIYFNLPYPPCNTNIVGFLPLFGAIPIRYGIIENYNGFIDIESDSINVVAKYKSYWNGNIITDTAYIYKFLK